MSFTPSTRRRLMLVGVLTAMAVARVVPAMLAQSAPATLPGLTDTLNHPPPTTGTYAYNSFVPPNTGGASYVDPVFGSTVRRITTDHAEDDIYAKNMYWNADATRYYHRGKIVDTTTGAVTHTVPTGDPNYDAGFDPIDPNVCFYWSGSTIHKVTLGANGAKTDVVYVTLPSASHPLGGSMNWLDASGRLLLVSYGSEPSLRVYDRQNLAAGPFTGTATAGSNGGYSALSPDGKFVLTFGGEGASPGYGTGQSWSIDLATRTVSAVSPNFWSYCGDHGTFISPSDGKDYMIVFDCYNHHDVMRIDVTRNVSGQNEDGQRSGQKVLLANVDWSFDAHFSAVARGAYRDWVFLSTEDGSDGINASVGTWKPYRQEIIAMNVITGEVRRLAHHRSRGRSDYYAQPRVCVSWSGEYVGWASNFNQSGVHDIFLIPFGAGSSSTSGDTVPPSVTVTYPANNAVVSGTTSITAAAADNVGVAGVQLQVSGVNLGPEITSGAYAANWNTAAGLNGTYTVTAIARDAAGNMTTSAAVTVTVNNLILLPPPDTLPPGPLFRAMTNFADSRPLAANMGLEMAAGNSAIARQFGLTDGAHTVNWQVVGTTVTAFIDGTVAWTGTAYATTVLRLAWTGSEMQALRNGTVRARQATTQPVKATAGGTLFPALTVR
jgi:hypothetical protein